VSELKKLEFSKIITRYESTAVYDNHQGDKFFVKAYGSSTNEINARTQNLFISLDISTDKSSESITVSDLIPKAENQPDSSLETHILSETENIEEVIQPLDIFLDPLTMANLKAGRKLNFAFENRLPEIMWRVLPDDDLRPITLASSSTEIYRIGPFTAVEAIITVQSGNANFSLYESTTGQGNWGNYVKKIPVSSGNSQPLSYTTNQNKYFKLMVQGKPGTNYTITGDWVVT
jgi:glucose dehydrogenase